MIKLEYRNPRLAAAEGPTVEASTQNHILAATVTQGILKDIFRITTPDNDKDADRPDLGEKRPPK